jgi:hypothetical protein
MHEHVEKGVTTSRVVYAQQRPASMWAIEVKVISTGLKT